MPKPDITPFSAALSITTTATNNTLARVIAHLHRHGAYVQHLNWVAPDPRDCGHARMTVIAHFEYDCSQNLRTSLAQLVDVLDVRHHTTAHSEDWDASTSTWW